MTKTLSEVLVSYDPSNNSSVEELLLAFKSIAGDEACVDGNIVYSIAQQKIVSYLKNNDSIQLAKRFLNIYMAQCKEDKHRIKNLDDHGVYKEPRCHVGQLLYLVICNLGYFAEHCLDDLKVMLLSDYPGYYHVASCMLADSACKNFYDIETITKVIKKWGLNEYPYNFGKALIKAAQNNPQLKDELVEALNQENANILSSLLYVLPDLQIDPEKVVRRLLEISKRSEDDVKKMSLLALEKMKK